MSITTGTTRPIRILVRGLALIVATGVLASGPAYLPAEVSAHSGPVFGPACGAATIDGVVKAGEWSSASRQTFLMHSPSGADPFTVTVYVMNRWGSLYLGITINDDEFSTVGTWLPQGDYLRIDFDNDHSGSLFALADDNLSVSAGFPQFADCHIYAADSSSARLDTQGGGTSDGAGAASRVGGLNHFELRHLLCSGDSLDFCLHATATVGFRLEYLDAQADGSFGGSQFFPGSDSTSEADIIIGHCAPPDFHHYLPLVRRAST